MVTSKSTSTSTSTTTVTSTNSPSSSTSSGACISTTNISLCQECDKVVFLYQCPRCGHKTCSLACCVRHKNRTGCNGQRDRTKFYAICNMSDSTLRSDFHFLENVVQTVRAGKRLAGSLGGGAGVNNSNQKNKRHHSIHANTAEQQPLHPILQIQQQEKDAMGEVVHDREQCGRATTLTATSALALAATATEISTLTEPSASNEQLIISDEKSLLETSSSSLPPTDNNKQIKRNVVQQQQPVVAMTTSVTSPKLRRLVIQAKERGVSLLLMPTCMERHKSNTTYHNNKQDILYWKVDFLFRVEQNDDKETDNNNKGAKDSEWLQEQEKHNIKSNWKVVTEQKMSEHTELLASEQVQRFLRLEHEQKNEGKPVQHNHGSDLYRWHFLLKKLPSPSNSPRYVELHADTHNTTLHMALNGRTIIEYPTIHVVPTKLLHLYPRMIEEVV